jgi:hypothetical protein
MLTSLLRQQDGVVARRQLLDHGHTDNDIETWVRRRVLTRLGPGVYLGHTGSPTWHQQVWASTLRLAPAAAAGRTALALAGLSRQPDTIEVLVAHERRLRARPPGVHVRRSRSFDRVALVGTHPPRVRLEHAVLSVTADSRSALDRVALVGDALQSRLTTADRLVAELEATERYPDRRLMLDVLDDAAAGVCSALEHRYLIRVERPHGIPTARRQVSTRIAGSRPTVTWSTWPAFSSWSWTAASDTS